MLLSLSGPTVLFPNVHPVGIQSFNIDKVLSMGWRPCPDEEDTTTARESTGRVSTSMGELVVTIEGNQVKCWTAAI